MKRKISISKNIAITIVLAAIILSAAAATLVTAFIVSDGNISEKERASSLHLPEGIIVCGYCSGCGEEHLIIEGSGNSHEHTDCGCAYDCHCHLQPGECDCEN